MRQRVILNSSLLICLAIGHSQLTHGAIGSSELLSPQSLAPGIQLSSVPQSQHLAIDYNGLPAISLDEKLKLKSLAINETLGVCACGSLEYGTSNAKPVGQTSLKGPGKQRFAISVVTFDFALKIFSDLERIARGDGGSITDGCYARAQKMAFTLERRGIVVGKVMARGRFNIQSENLKKGAVTWGFHVAPTIVIDNGDRRSVWVLDPSLFSEPVPIESWLALLMQNSKSKLDEVFVTNRFVFHPNQKDLHISNWRPIDMYRARTLIESLRR